MGKKAEVGSIKWEANKQKAKGLQKLKWYCQMCEKQCRDENGFKCHIQSETHIRQMKLFGSNSGKFVEDFSKQFENGFMELMRTRYCKTKVLSNRVYNDYIADKEHIHMNATRWVSLAGFCRYLGQTGRCKIEETDRGWLLEYIDKEALERENINRLRQLMEINEEERKQQRILSAVAEAKQKGSFNLRDVPTSMTREEGQPKFCLKLQPKDENIKIESSSMTTECEKITNPSADLFKTTITAADLLESEDDGEQQEVFIPKNACVKRPSHSETESNKTNINDLFDNGKDEEIIQAPPPKKRNLFFLNAK
eukprot:GDKJ01028548.1.p1 GENE.GDKJ01028548.1~~GDKJ01028548.1.p1  ORF type:complete len:310 (-),score=53.73 GDKJ01028548.1:71-1000(-)